MYMRFRLPPKGGGLRPKMWKQYCFEGFLSELGLVDDSLSVSDALLAFQCSKMFVADEIGSYSKFESFTFIDFLEVLGRIAELKSWPSVEEIQRTMANAKLENSTGTDVLSWRLAVETGAISFDRPPSAAWAAEKTRPLHLKLGSLLDYIFRKSMYQPGDQAAFSEFSIDAFVKKMKKLDKNLGS